MLLSIPPIQDLNGFEVLCTSASLYQVYGTSD